MEGSDKIPLRFDENRDGYGQWKKDLNFLFLFKFYQERKTGNSYTSTAHRTREEGDIKNFCSGYEKCKRYQDNFKRFRVFGRDKNFTYFNAHLAFENYVCDKKLFHRPMFK